MILVVNCFNEEGFAVDFDRVVAGHLERAGYPSRHVRATEVAEGMDLSQCTHLLISGSVASATEEQPWDQVLAGLVHRFVDQHKPILGICYGHQFLAKVLAGPGHVRKAQSPEFGFLSLPLAPNPLFHGLVEPMVMASHFDEAFDLPPDFKILAASPIWRTVFCCTPEMIPPAPADADAGRMDQNRLIFRNFAAAKG